MHTISRRGVLLGAVGAAGSLLAADAPVIETHVHLFDPARVPYAPDGPYKPPAYTLEDHVKLVQAAGLAHSIIVHPEPYQDDHRYLEYCLERAPSKGFFKSSCLFDPIDKRTPSRMDELVKKTRGAVVALRIHEMHEPGTPSTTAGMIRDRDLRDPQLAECWRAAGDLGLMIQLHMIPNYAPQIGELASKFSKIPVLIDHLARAGHGTPADFDAVLQLAKLPRVYMKYSGTGVSASSKEQFPYPDAKPIVRRTFDAFGPDRMVWGELGTSTPNFEKAVELFESMFDFASEPDRAKIRGLTAKKLFGFS
jgi:L-fuconolactonase